MWSTGSGQQLRTLAATIPYRNAGRVISDGQQLLSEFPAMKAHAEDFNFDNGDRRKMVVLKGTVPTVYRGATYSTPMAIYMTLNYPQEAPMVYVTPTPDMVVKRGHPIVRLDGAVETHPWRPATTLVQLIKHCCDVFGQAPPLFKRSSDSTPTVDRGEAIQQLRAQVTSKLCAMATEEYQRHRDAVDEERFRQEKLDARADDIRNGIQKLRDGKRNLEQYIASVNAKAAELESWIKEHNESKTDTDADSLVTPCTKLQAQALKAVSESCAIQDAMFCLQSALENDAITLPEFVKHVRNLAKKQFESKALAMKIDQALDRAAHAGMRRW